MKKKVSLCMCGVCVCARAYVCYLYLNHLLLTFKEIVYMFVCFLCVIAVLSEL